jgi:hypothetical protein
MLGTDLSQFLEEFPFATAMRLVEHFNESKHMSKAILERELGLQKFSRRWMPDSLSDSQKLDRIRKARYMLDVLRGQTDKSVNCIIIGDESWFVYLYLSDHMLASWRETLSPPEKQTNASRKVMLTIFVSETILISLHALAHDQAYTQEYLIHNILPGFVNEKRPI